MKSEIKIPAMGESITEVTIGSILTPSETLVKQDQEILEIETDKVNQLLYAPQAGLLKLFVKSGEVVKIGQVIGAIDSDASSSPQTLPESKSEPDMKKEDKKSTSVAETIPQPKQSIPKQIQEESIRQTKEDFIAEIQKKENIKAPETQFKQQEVEPKNQRKETRRPLSRIRKVIANRLVEVQQSTAMLTTFNEIDLSQIIELREKYKENFIKKHGTKLGFMSFFVKASVAALEAFPDINSYIHGDEIVHRDYYDIGVAVGTEKGVIVPVVRNCDHLSFAQIELAIENFAKKAREEKLSVEDLQGGGFTITNGGIYGSLLSTPILNYSQSGILGMHKIEKRPVVVDDQIVIRSMMYVALSYDHRIVDGKEAVSFLVYLKNKLEDPARLLLDI